MSWGAYSVEVAWEAIPPGYRGWLLGIAGFSELGLTTWLGWASAIEESEWTDETSRVRSIRIARGRDSELDQINPGSCSLTLRNADGRFSPDYAASPLWPNVAPMRLVRVGCTLPIAIGSGATNRASSLSLLGRTRIDTGNPCTLAGTITSISIWAATALVNCEVATFYETAPNTFSTRATATIGSVVAGSKQTFTVSLACEIGDYLGIYASSGSIEADTVGGPGMWLAVGDYIPCVAQVFVFSAAYTISIEASGTAVFPLGRFLIDRIEPHPRLDEQVCDIECIDALSWLELRKATHIYTGLAIGALVGEALDLAEWPDDLRTLDTGQLAGITVTYTDAPILSGHILAALESERGILYIGRDGKVVYEDRHHRYKGAHLIPQSTINADMRDFVPRLEAQDIRNTVKVDYSGGGSIEKTDADSKVWYGPRNLDVDAMLLGLGDATSLAEWLLSRHKDPHSKQRLVLINQNAATYIAMLAREISDRITVVEPKTGVSAGFFIERVEHEIMGMQHRTVWTLTPCDANQYWLLGMAGYSELGQKTKLGF